MPHEIELANKSGTMDFQVRRVFWGLESLEDSSVLRTRVS